MNTGHVISGLGHAGLIGFVLFGGVFRTEPLPFEVTEVSVISGADFDALFRNNIATPQTEVALPPTPDPEPETAEAPAEPTELAALPPDPLPEPAPEEPVEETPPQVEQTSPPPPAPPEEAPPAPEQADRVAPEAVEEVPDTVADPERSEATEESEEPAPEPEEAQDTATAPEAASTEIVTEAETPSGPPAILRPPSRLPDRPLRAAAPAPEEPAEEAPTTETPAPEEDNASGLAAALAEALTDAPQASNSAPAGPPLSVGEKDALRVAVSSCWNVGSLSTEALGTTVTVAVSMAEDGKPKTGTIKMLDYSGGSEAAARQAFEAARRAIIRCGARGFKLPQEKYAHWRDIEMTFNPERMRIK